MFPSTGLSCRLDDRKLVYLFPIYQDDLYQVDINCWYICSYELDDLPQNISLKLVDWSQSRLVDCQWLPVNSPRRRSKIPHYDHVVFRPRFYSIFILNLFVAVSWRLPWMRLHWMKETENYVPKPVFSIHHPQKSPLSRFFSPQMVNILFGTYCLTRTDMTIVTPI